MIEKNQRLIVILWAAVLAVNVAVAAVDTGEIDIVYNKAFVDNEVLGAGDFEIIDAFVDTAIEDILIAENNSEAVEARAAIVARRGTSRPTQYSASFINSAKKHLDPAIKEIQESDAGERKTWIQRNLLILIADLQTTELSGLGMTLLDDTNTTIRYWAVKSVTNPEILRQLNSQLTANTELADEITARLSTLAQTETHAEILDLVAGFAARLNTPRAKQLLLKIADLRIQAYQDWTVEYELMDAVVLKSLADEILSQPSENKALVSRTFAQLYSYAIQRYILGADVLSETSKEDLASVIVDIEQTTITRLLARPQSTIKKAIEKDSYPTLEREHASLLGSDAQAGELAFSLGFDYGKAPAGRTITAPKQLAPPPQSVKSEDTEETGA